MMEQETVKPLTTEEYLVAYNTGYQAGLAKSQRDDDDAFWFRQYSGWAMQGILASCTNNSQRYAAQGEADAICKSAMMYAKALLEEVKR